jgi:hypothetical protein
MDQSLLNFVSTFNYVNILIVSFVTTLIVSAINMVENKVNDGILVVGVAALVTFLRTQFEGFQLTLPHVQNLIFEFITTLTFAYLFFRYLGSYFTNRLFGGVKDFIGSKLDKSGWTGQTPGQVQDSVRPETPKVEDASKP